MVNSRNTGGIVASMFCILFAPAVKAAETTPSTELEALKRMMQEVISQNEKLEKRVRELEAEMIDLRARMSESDPSVVGGVAGAGPEEIGEAYSEEHLGAETTGGAPAIGQAAVEPLMTDNPLSEEDGGLADMINEYVSFGGAVEVEADWSENFEDESQSDIRLETADIDFEVRVNDWVTAELAIEWDGEEDEVTIDEAFITLGDTDRYPVFLTAGRIFVPFGLSTGDEVGDTLAITDPLTFEIFETREDAVLVGLEAGGFLAGVYAFNGDSDEGGGDHIEQFGGTVRYGIENNDTGLVAGVELISSAFDSDGLTEEFPEALDANDQFGLATHVEFHMRGFSLTTEYNAALHEADFASDGETFSISPKAWQVEGAYTTELYGKETFLALNYSQSDEVAGAFPESRITATIGRWLTANLRLAFEYLHDDDYERSEGGTGRSANALTGQLTYEW